MTIAVVEPARTSAGEASAKHYEVADWRRSVKPPMGALGARIAGEIQFAVGSFAKPASLGLPVVRVLFRLADGLQRRPDVAFVSAERAKASPLSPVDACATPSTPRFNPSSTAEPPSSSTEAT